MTATLCIAAGETFSINNQTYTIKEPCGSGGCGVNYLLEERGNMVYGKFAKDYTQCLNSGVQLASPDDIQKHILALKSEFEMLNKLHSHANVPTPLAFSEVRRTNGQRVTVLIMDYLEDYTTLDEFISSRHRIDTELSEQVVLQLLAEIDTIHKQNIIHRDIKPSNIMIKKTLRKDNIQLKIIDFGSSKPKGKTTSYYKGTYSDSSHPEQKSQCYRKKTWEGNDIYSVFHIAYELFTGKEAPSCEERLANHQTTLIPPRKLNPKLARHWNDCIVQVLTEEKLADIPTIEEIHDKLTSKKKAPSSRVHTSLNWIIKCLCFLAVMTLLYMAFSPALAVLNYQPNTPTTPRPQPTRLIIQQEASATPIMQPIQPPSPSPYLSFVKVNSSLNMRVSDSNASQVIDRIPTDTPVNILQSTPDGWVEIQYNNKKGFVFGRFLLPAPRGFIIVIPNTSLLLTLSPCHTVAFDQKSLPLLAKKEHQNQLRLYFSNKTTTTSSQQYFREII